MSFPKKVADEVLVKSGRRCSICNKFCGTKIELHHIKQNAEAGEDTIDNCIFGMLFYQLTLITDSHVCYR